MHVAYLYHYGFDLCIKVMTGIISVGILLPMTFNQNTYCEEDEDCPLILRCCIYELFVTFHDLLLRTCYSYYLPHY